MRVAGGNGQNGATGSGISSGAGGNGAYGGGSGGAARTSADGTADGNPGNVAGGGGGGARTQASGGARTGGGGAGGKVVITWVTYDLNISSTAGGSVTTPGEGSFTCGNGTIVDLVASPDANHRFVNWTGSVGTVGNVTAAVTNVTMNGDYFITANFVRHWHLTVSSTAGGSVTTPGIGSFTYDNGTAVDLVAVADEGHRFVGWAGDVSTIADVYAAETTIIMSGDYSITAEFEIGGPIQYQCNLVISSTAGGSVIEPGEGIFTIDNGTVVYLTAAPDIGYQFERWTGDVGTVADIESMATTITMDDSCSIGAKFTAVGWYSIGGYIPVGGCFIATAAYGTPMAKEIQVLREFRDKYLLTNPVGSSLVDFYYRVSPPVAEFITDHPSLKPIVRAALLPAVAVSTLAVNATVPDNAVMVSLLVLVSVVAAATLARRRESRI